VAQSRRNVEFVMPFELFVTIPSLVMAEIAWWLRFAVVLTCLLLPFAVAVGAIALRWIRIEHQLAGPRHGHASPLAHL
jgi:hypothetical protein